MGEKAEATARRIDQSIADLERQISWVTRASAVTIDQHRADYAQLLNQVPAVYQLSLLDGYGREQLRLSRTSISIGSKADFSRDFRFTDTNGKSVSYAPATFQGSHAFMSISVAHSGFNAGVTVAEIDLRFLADFLGDAQVGKSSFAYVIDPHGQVLASSSKGPEVGKFLAGTPQVDAVLPKDGSSIALRHRPRRQFGADGRKRRAQTRLARVLRAADRAGPGADPRSTAAGRASDRAWACGRDPRRHRPRPPHAGADHGAAERRAAARRRRFQPSHRGPYQGRTGRTRRPVQQHGRPAAGNLLRPRGQGRSAYPRPRAIDQRAEGAGGSRSRGRLLARSQRGAADGGERARWKSPMPMRC